MTTTADHGDSDIRVRNWLEEYPDDRVQGFFMNLMQAHRLDPLTAERILTGMPTATPPPDTRVLENELASTRRALRHIIKMADRLRETLESECDRTRVKGGASYFRISRARDAVITLRQMADEAGRAL